MSFQPHEVLFRVSRRETCPPEDRVLLDLWLRHGWNERDWRIQWNLPYRAVEIAVWQQNPGGYRAPFFQIGLAPQHPSNVYRVQLPDGRRLVGRGQPGRGGALCWDGSGGDRASFVANLPFAALNGIEGDPIRIPLGDP